MNEMHYPSAAGEAIERLERLPEDIRGLARSEAEKAIGEQLEAMKQDGRLTLMSDEEERLIRAFRRFKMNMRKPGEVFSWQTRPDAVGAPLIISGETGLIRDPQEVEA